MTKNTKILLGILSFIPILGFVAYFYGIFSTVFTNIPFDGEHHEPPGPEFIKGLIGYVAFFLFSMLINFGLMIFYVVCSIKDKSATENDKILWTILLVVVSTLAIPLYWIIRIWMNDDFTMKEQTNISELGDS